MIQPSKPWSILFMHYLKKHHRSQKTITPDLFCKYVKKFCMLYSLRGRPLHEGILYQQLYYNNYVRETSGNVLKLNYPNHTPKQQPDYLASRSQYANLNE